MRCPGDMNKIRYTRLVLEIWGFTVYLSGKRRSLLHPNKAQRSPPPPPRAIHSTR